jgi:hypothetical protein
LKSIPEKYSTLASGATTIGSAERAPDDIIIKKNSKLKVTGGYNILEPILEKRIFFDYSLGGYYHRER